MLLSQRPPFQSRVLHFTLPEEECRLPFAVGGATQHHEKAVSQCRNSQDSLGIIVHKKAIVGVVTDGCSGSHPKLKSHSNNEVGAKLIAYIVSRAALRLALSQTRLPAEDFVKILSMRIGRALNSMLRAFAGADEIAKEMFASDFLMATVLGFVVTDRRFIVFYAGDGIIGMNGVTHDLEGEAGIYFTNNLFVSSADPSVAERHSLKVFASGSSVDLKNIFLGTDGLCGVVRDYPDQFANFLNTSPPSPQVTNGFDFLLQEFRQRLAWNPKITLKLEDDATFALLRRIDTEAIPHDHAH